MANKWLYKSRKKWSLIHINTLLYIEFYCCIYKSRVTDGVMFSFLVWLISACCSSMYTIKPCLVLATFWCQYCGLPPNPWSHGSTSFQWGRLKSAWERPWWLRATQNYIELHKLLKKSSETQVWLTISLLLPTHFPCIWYHCYSNAFWHISLYTHPHIQVCCTSPNCVIITNGTSL